MRLAVLPVVLVLGACGGSGTDPNDDGGEGFTAKIDGASWSASFGLGAVNNTPGRYFTTAVGNLDYTMTFTLENVPGPHGASIAAS
ncbi:MAG: hypothetical protein AB7T31_05830 [Gemmatimonadales bacterium]